MTIQQILNATSHRPWDLPKNSWDFYQEWNNAIFLHWPVELEDLRKLVPKGLEIDLFDGTPWVSVVAFTMEKVRLKHLPPFPPISNFHEINIRTYVKANNKTGVYFLSIEGGSLLSCKLAKAISKLPYRYSRINRFENQYQSNNIEFKDKLNIEYSLGSHANGKSALEKWLTERYALFQDGKNSINTFEIHHLEWPIIDMDLRKFEFNYSRFNHLIKGEPKLMHYSNGVKVLAWNKMKTSRSSDSQ